MTAGPAMRSRPGLPGHRRPAPAASARSRTSAPMPATDRGDRRRTTSTRTTRPTPGTRRPLFSAIATAADAEQDAEDDGDRPRRPASAAPPPGSAASAVRVCGSSRGRVARLHAPRSAGCRGRRSVDRMPTDPPATLAAWLRTRSDEQLSALLVARPDVARPAPSDVVALASRLAVPVSVDRALDELDAATLQVLDVVLLAPDRRRRPPTSCPRPLPDLPDDVLDGRAGAARPPGRCCGATTCCAPPTRCAAPSAIPAGWAAGRPSCACSCPADLPRRARRAATPEERAVLERLAGERPVGHLPDGPADGARTPARRLLQRGLLARIDALNVELPAGDRPAPARRPPLRPAAAAPRAGRRRRATRSTVDRRAAGAALESVGRVAELLGAARGGAGRAAAQRRGRRPRPEAAGPGAARRRARRRLAAGAGLRRRAARRRRPAPRRVAAHPRLRHLARAGPRPTAGPRWPPAGWPASGCRRWSGSATSPARRSTRSPPTWSGTPRRRSAARR